MADFTLRPHTFKVDRNTGADQVPPTDDVTPILTTTPCNTQTGASGNITGESDVMGYDYVLFYDFELDEDGNRIEDTKILVEDLVTTTLYGKVIVGNVKKWFPGQITNRIWFNEISS